MARHRTSTALLLLAVAACTPDATSTSPLAPGDAVLARGGSDANRSVAAARAGTARYHRVEEALAAGYVPVSRCVSIPSGGMGFHYAKLALVDGVYDPSQPEALLYEPTKNGELRLVAVEYLYVGEEAPESGVEGEFTPATVPGAPWDFDMHAWIWSHNPAGMFEPFNPNVSCEHAPAP